MTSLRCLKIAFVLPLTLTLGTTGCLAEQAAQDMAADGTGRDAPAEVDRAAAEPEQAKIGQTAEAWAGYGGNGYGSHGYSNHDWSNGGWGHGSYGSYGGRGHGSYGGYGGWGNGGYGGWGNGNGFTQPCDYRYQQGCGGWSQGW